MSDNETETNPFEGASLEELEHDLAFYKVDIALSELALKLTENDATEMESTFVKTLLMTRSLVRNFQQLEKFKSQLDEIQETENE